MKPAATILCILMLFFTAQPLLIHCQQKMETATEMSSCCGGKSCSKKEDPSKKEKKDCAAESACNPFAACSQCQYVHVANAFLVEQPAVTAGVKKSLGNENIEAGFIGNFWQPPEA
jgi:hypothetical protein